MQIRIILQCFASFHAVSSLQVAQVLRMLQYPQDRSTAMVVMWSRIEDGGGIYTAFQALSLEEQGQVGRESTGICRGGADWRSRAW